MVPKISIITVVYNAAQDLRKTLQNLAELKYENKEIIVVDGASTDGTAEVIAEFAVEINQLISEKDSGIYDAMNKGLSIATGHYVWFVNAGDLAYDPHILENIFKGQETYSDVYYGETLITSEEGKVLGLRKKKLPKRLSWRSFKRGMVVCHQSFIVMRDIAPMYDLKYRYAADVKWVMECLKRSKVITNTHQIISVFRTGGTSTSKRWESLLERFSIMRSYFGLYPTIYYHLLMALKLPYPKYRKLKFSIKPPTKSGQKH